MPIVNITYADVQPRESLERLARRVHDAVTEELGVPDAAVNVLLTPAGPANWYAGGQDLATTFAAQKDKA